MTDLELIIYQQDKQIKQLIAERDKIAASNDAHRSDVNTLKRRIRNLQKSQIKDSGFTVASIPAYAVEDSKGQIIPGLLFESEEEAISFKEDGEKIIKVTITKTPV